jgi:hypothetical protein
MLSNNCRSAQVINAYLPIGKSGGEYSSDHRKLKTWWQHPANNFILDFFIWGVTNLFKNQAHVLVIHHP